MLIQTYGHVRLMIFKIFFFFFFFTNLFGANEFTSPIHSTNQYINQLLFYRPYANAAIIKKKPTYNIDISQSNIFQKSTNLEADFGLTTLDLSFYYPISPNLEFSFDYPLYYVSAGFLDQPLDFIHTTLGITTTRENEGHIDNQLHFIITDKINKSSPYFASGNPQMELKYVFYKDATLHLSCNGGVKIPLGNKSDGFTTEKADVMLGFQIQKDYENISWLLNFVATKNSQFKLSNDIISHNMRYFLYVANRFPLKYLLPLNFVHNTDFLFTYEYSSAPYESSDVKFNSSTHLLQFALRKYLSHARYIDFFFNQNTIPRHNEADVTFGVSYNFKGL
ncbi:DUF3187 family protein [Sulfurimonas sp.]